MIKKKKVAIIGTVGLPANYGGFETMVKYLTKQKNEENNFTVFCQKTPKTKQLRDYNGCKLIYLPFKANGFQSIIYDVLSIIKSWFKYDTLLILGTPGCIILPVLNLFKNTKTIINFGGLEWARDKWGFIGKKYLKLTECLAVRYATDIVADNQYFCNYIKESYGKDSTLIEYGGDHIQKGAVSAVLLNKYPFLNKPYDVSVSRAQTDNNLHLILEVYSKLPEKNLVLISNYDKFEYGRQLKKQYGNFSNLYLQDAVYNQGELDIIRSNADYYIHSHSFCGTAPSLVEAMNLGLPIISFDVPTNRFTTEDKAVYFKSIEDLISILKSVTDDKKSQIADSMKEIASRRYTWKRISDKYAELF